MSDWRGDEVEAEELDGWRDESRYKYSLDAFRRCRAAAEKERDALRAEVARLREVERQARRFVRCESGEEDPGASPCRLHFAHLREALARLDAGRGED